MILFNQPTNSINILINILAVVITSFTILTTFLYVNRKFRQIWFSWFYTMLTPIVKHGSDSVRAKLFEKLAHIKPDNPSDKLVILEIGPARGNNFEFYPPNSRIIALDYNSYFEKYFRENKSKFPNVLCEDFVNGNAEDMAQIANNSVDVVVATYILCSVNDRRKTLNEIKRVLKKGGVYFFMEHVGYPHTNIKHIILYGIQLLIHPIWYAYLGGCNCHRRSWTYINNAGFNSVQLNYDYPNEMLFVARAHVWGTATT